MEIRARYTLVGTFVLLAIAAVFSAVYWLQSAGGLGPRALVQVRYAGTVAGLLKGSPVHFNGVRVGEVLKLDLDAATPRQILVTIGVDPQTPLRADTKASIDFQGLSGAPVVALSGGTPSATILKGTDRGPPTLVAEDDAGQSVMVAAREAIRRIDMVVQSNAEPLHALIINIEKFSAALARNSERIDGIVTGIERLTGGGKLAVQVVDLSAVAAFPPARSLPRGQLYVPEPSALTALDQAKITVRGTITEGSELSSAQWPDVLTKVVQMRVVQSLENAGYTRVLARSLDGVTADYQLVLDVRRFQLSAEPEPRVEIEYGAKLIAGGGKIVGARMMRASAAVAAIDLKTIGAAFDSAFAETQRDLVPWALDALSMADARPPADAEAPMKQP